MTERERHLLAVIRLAMDMRQAQRDYFGARYGSHEQADALATSLVMQEAFDEAAAKVTAKEPKP